MCHAINLIYCLDPTPDHRHALVAVYSSRRPQVVQANRLFPAGRNCLQRPVAGWHLARPRYWTVAHTCFESTHHHWNGRGGAAHLLGTSVEHWHLDIM